MFVFTHVYDFFGRLGVIEDVLVKRLKIKILSKLWVLVLLTRMNFFLWFSSSISSISSRSMSTSFGNSVCKKKIFFKENDKTKINTTLNEMSLRFRSYKLHLTASFFNLQIRQTFSFSKVERSAQKIIKNVTFEFNTKINIALECSNIFYKN